LRTHTLATIADRISHSAKLYDEGNASGSKVVESRYEKQISKAAAEAQEHVSAHSDATSNKVTSFCSSCR
jgi:hypothetical protein